MVMVSGIILKRMKGLTHSILILTGMDIWMAMTWTPWMQMSALIVMEIVILIQPMPFLKTLKNGLILTVMVSEITWTGTQKTQNTIPRLTGH